MLWAPARVITGWLVVERALIIFAVIAEVPIQFDRSRNLARRTNCLCRVSEFVYLWQTREIAPQGGNRGPPVSTTCVRPPSFEKRKEKKREREKKRKREKNVSPRCCRTTLLDVWVESKRGEVERCCPLPQLIIPYPGVVIMSTSWVCERSSIISFTSRRHCSRSWPAQFRKSLRNNKSAWWIPATVHARSAIFFFFFFFFLSLPIVITPRRVRGSPSSSIVDHDESSSSSSSSSSYDTFHTFLEIGRN